MRRDRACMNKRRTFAELSLFIRCVNTYYTNGVVERRGRELNPQNPLEFAIYKIAGLDRCPTSPHIYGARGRSRTGGYTFSRRACLTSSAPALHSNSNRKLESFQQIFTGYGLDGQVGLNGRMNLPNEFTRSPKRVQNNGGAPKRVPLFCLWEANKRKAWGAEALRLLVSQRATV